MKLHYRLFIIAILAVGLCGVALRMSAGEEPKKANPPTGPTYQFHIGRTDTDLFFVFDPATGHTWGYSSRDAFGYRWVDYGEPGKKMRPDDKPSP